MLLSERNKFIDYLKDVGIDVDIMFGFDLNLDLIEKGMHFYMTPAFVYSNSTDNFTHDIAIKKDYNGTLVNYKGKVLICYTDKFKVVKIKRKATKTSIAHIQVINLRTNVTFDLFTDHIKLENTSTLNLFFE